MLDYDYAEEQALKEAEKYAYTATENVPAKQQKEAYNQIKYFIQIGIRLMREHLLGKTDGCDVFYKLGNNYGT